MTKPVWPKQSQVTAFYGKPCRESILVSVPVPWHFKGQKTSHIMIHPKLEVSLKRALDAIWTAVGKSQAKIEELRYDVFDGCYNCRNKRGSASTSMHAYGIACDWDAEDNPFHVKKHRFTNDSILVKAFTDEGWDWGGDWNSPDAMHVQAARVH